MTQGEVLRQAASAARISLHEDGMIWNGRMMAAQLPG